LFLGFLANPRAILAELRTDNSIRLRGSVNFPSLLAENVAPDGGNGKGRLASRLGRKGPVISLANAPWNAGCASEAETWARYFHRPGKWRESRSEWQDLNLRSPRPERQLSTDFH
jgi:hypothetical protein